MARKVVRYFFLNERTHKTTTIDAPRLHPGYKGMKRTYHSDGRIATEKPMVLLDGVLQEGRRMMATQMDNVKCTTGCKRATEPWCQCSCGGKNHGIHHKGPKADELDGLV